MRLALSLVAGPLFLAALLLAAGIALTEAGMLDARLSYDALGGPAAYVLYAVVVGLGVALFAFDRVVRAVRLRLAVADVRREARTLPPARMASPRPAVLPGGREVVARSVRVSRTPRARPAHPTLAAWR